MQRHALSVQAIWLTPLLNRVLRQIVNTAEFSDDCDFKWPETYIQTECLRSGNTSYRLTYFQSLEHNIIFKEFVTYINYSNLIGIYKEY